MTTWGDIHNLLKWPDLTYISPEKQAPRFNTIAGTSWQIRTINRTPSESYHICYRTMNSLQMRANDEHDRIHIFQVWTFPLSLSKSVQRKELMETQFQGGNTVQLMEEALPPLLPLWVRGKLIQEHMEYCIGCLLMVPGGWPTVDRQLVCIQSQGQVVIDRYDGLSKGQTIVKISGGGVESPQAPQKYVPRNVQKTYQHKTTKQLNTP